MNSCSALDEIEPGALLGHRKITKAPGRVARNAMVSFGHRQVNENSAAVSTILGKTVTPVAQHTVVHFDGFTLT